MLHGREALAYGHDKEITVCKCERRSLVPLPVKQDRASSSRSLYRLACWPVVDLYRGPSKADHSLIADKRLDWWGR